MIRPAAMLRSPLAAALFLAGVGLVAMAALWLVQGTPRGPAPSAIGGPFALVNQDGKPVTEAALKGRPTLVFFGYTHCPDVCPTTLTDMSALLNALGTSEPVAALFITVDPERDTPAVMKDYLSSFDPRITGLTGDPAAVAAAEHAYRVYAKKVPGATATDYSMDHTALIYLMNKDGVFVSALNLEQAPEAAAAEFRRDLSS